MEPFAIESYGYGLDDDARLISNSGFHVTPYSANDCTVASLQNLLTEDFDYIMFNTHGSPNGKWMATHERATTTTESNEAYIQMKRDGYLAISFLFPTLLVPRTFFRIVELPLGEVRSDIVAVVFCIYEELCETTCRGGLAFGFVVRVEHTEVGVLGGCRFDNGLYVFIDQYHSVCTIGNFAVRNAEPDHNCITALAGPHRSI